jgi:transcriptional regulator with XRE-family HTH domain
MKPTQVGQNVRELRLASGLTQQKLADLAKINRLSVVYLESGKHRSTKSTTLLRLAKALQTDVGELLRSRSA